MLHLRAQWLRYRLLAVWPRGPGPYLRRRHWSIQAELDLHHHRVDEARIALVEFFSHAKHAGLRCVKVIHGKGLHSEAGAPLREAVVGELLGAASGLVHAFASAAKRDGGSGATYVMLRGTR